MKLKNSPKVILIALLLCTTAASAQVNIVGNWHVSCALEKTASGVAFCPICPVEYEEDSSSLAIQSFGMSITKDSIAFSTNTANVTVAYNQDKNTDTLILSYKNRAYKLTILTLDEGNMLILKDGENNILHLLRTN
jgi:hypothetical protein